MHVLFLSLIVLAATATDAERADTSAPKRVLISTGEDHKAHVWKLTAPAKLFRRGTAWVAGLSP